MRLLVFFLFLIQTIICYSDDDENAYTFGVFPYLPIHTLYELYSPIADDFRKTLNKGIIFRTKSSFADYEAALKSREFDIALIQPFDYPPAHDEYGYLPIARLKENLAAIIIVKKDSPYQSIMDLKNLIIANPDKTSAVSKLTDRAIINTGLDPQQDFIRIYKSNHFSCIQAVLIGTAQACGTALQGINQYIDAEIFKRIRIIHTTEMIPHIVYIVHQRVPESDREKIKQSILGWDNNSQKGINHLQVIKGIPFVEALNSDYDVLRD